MNRANKSILITLITLVFLITTFLLHNYVPVIEHLFYDLNFSLRKSAPSDTVVIVGIDAESIAEISAFPWSRSITASLIEKIEAANPRAIALDFLFPKRPEDQGNDSLARVFQRVSNLLIGLRFDHVTDNPKENLALIAPSAYKHRFMILKNQDQLTQQFPYAARKLHFGDSSLTRYAHRGGFLNISTSRTSQKLREIIHVIRVGNEYFPSFSLAAAAAYLNLSKEKFALDGNGAVWLDDQRIPLTQDIGSTKLNFRGKPGTITTISALDILNSNNINPELLQNKLVFIGITDQASSPADFFITPTGTQFPGVEVWATSTLDLLSNSWIKSNLYLTLLNLLITLIIFPGFLIFFPLSKKKPIVILSTIFIIISIITGFLLLNLLYYEWNPGYHIYAWIFLITFLATVKGDIIIVKSSQFYIEPKGNIEANILPPPGDDDFIHSVPSTDTASFVVNQIATTMIQRIGKTTTVDVTLVETEPLGEKQPYKLPSVMTDPKTLAELQKLSGGRIVKLLGSGGMADVYLVWKPRMEVYRAIKVIKPDQSSQWIDRFETEIRILASLNHPNIVQCYSVGEWYTLPFLEMEFIYGTSLEEILKKKISFSPIEVTAIGILICRALSYAHNQIVTIYGETYKGIIHRDLKPANILMSKNGHIKLTDFGIARPEKVSFHTIDTGKIIGTLPYIAPEQLEEEAVTLKSDIYALGATLYELLTGTRAFPQTDIPALLSAKANGAIKPLHSSASLPEKLIRILGQSLAVHPEHRFSSAEEMASKLEDVLINFNTDSKTFLFNDLVNRVFRNN